MADKKSPFSSFLKNLGDTKFIQDLGDAAIKAIDSATKALENATATLESATDNHTPSDKCAAENKNATKDKKTPTKPTNRPLVPSETQSLRRVSPKQLGITRSSEIHTDKPQDGPCHPVPQNADNFKWIDSVLSNGIHIREFLWHEPEVYESAYASREDRPDSGGNMLAMYITGYDESDAPAGQTHIEFDPYICKFYNFEIAQTSFIICQKAFVKGTHLKSIKICRSIDVVEKQAFAALPNLINISFKSVSRFQDGVFQNCSSLESVKFSGIVHLGKRCFYRCQKLNHVTMPSSCTTIGQECFYKCQHLHQVTLPQSLKALEDRTFYNSGLQTIHLPQSLESIGESCFQDCNQLTEIELPAKCKVIGKYCFMSCGNLKHVHLPSKLRILSDKTFANCTSLESIDWPKYQSIDGEIYPKIGENILSGIYIYPDTQSSNGLEDGQNDNEPDTIFEVVDGVMKRVPRTPNHIGTDYILPPIPQELALGSNAAVDKEQDSSNQAKADTTKMPASATAAENIPNVETATPTTENQTTSNTASNTLADIATPAIKAITNAFQNLKTNVITQSQTLLDNLKNTSMHSPESGFQLTQGNYGVKITGYKGSQKRIVIPDGIKDIGDYAFQNNHTIEEVILPNSVWNIGQAAFKNCKSLKHISLPNNEFFVTMPSELFKGCTSLTTIIWNPNLKLIRRDSIEDCPLSGRALQFLQSKYVYSSKRNAYILPKIAKADKLSGSFTDEGQKMAPFPPAWQTMPPLPRLTERHERPQDSQNEQSRDIMNRSVSAVKDTFRVPSDKTSSGTSFDSNLPHSGKNAAKEILKTSPWDGNLYVSNNVLVGLKDNLTELIIPEYIHEIEVNAFNLGTELRSVVFKGKIKKLCANAFCGLTKLQSVIFEDDVEDIEANAFKGCAALSRVEFHKGLGALWDSCFANCTALEAVDLPDNCELIDKNCFSGCIRLKHVHLPKQIKAIKRNAFAYCISLETIDWPEPFVIDKHHYPKIEPLSFAQTLSSGDNWERFELKNGVYKRILVQAISEDPDGVFDMMLPGEANMYRRTPQLLMNAVLNAAWEISSGDELRYEYQMTLLKTCLEFARIFTAIYEDDRAERLNVIYYLRDTLFSHPEYTRNDISSVLPYALNDTLFAICGKGSIRKYNDECIIEMASPYLGIDLPRDKSKAEPSAAQKQIIDNMYNELHIGPHQPFRYDPWHTELTAIFNMEDADFYTFSNYMSQLANSIFQRYLRIEEDLSNDTNINAWCQAWNTFLHDNYSSDFHIVLFQTDKFENTLSHSLELYFVSILTWPQIHAIRNLLKPFHLEGIMTVFTMEMHFSDTSE